MLPLLVLLLVFSLPSTAELEPVPDTPKQIADDILDKKGREKPYRCKELAKVGTKSALKQLIRVCEELPEHGSVSDRNPPIERAIEAFVHFRGDDELAEKALSYLVKCAESDKPYRSEPALETMVEFGARAEKVLYELVENAATEKGRALAAEALLPFFARHATSKNLNLLLVHHRKTKGSKEADLRECLSGFPEDVALPVFGKYLKSDPRGDMLGHIFAVIEKYRSADTGAYLKKWLKYPMPQVQLAALSILEARGNGQHLKAVQRLAKSKDPMVRYRALCEVARLRFDDPAWEKVLAKMSRSSDHVQRQAAARTAGLLPWSKALEIARALCTDDHPAVRTQTYKTLVTLRRPACVELLIQRLGEEREGLQYRALVSLQNLTGQTLGPSQDRWQQWWSEAGSKEPLPSAARVARLDKERTERRMEHMTRGAFFDLPMYSRRVIFVVDGSGSMSIALSRNKKKRPGARSREDAATDQLIQTLKVLPDATLLNLVFFGTKVATWKEGLTRLTSDSRDEAIEFIQSPGVAGFTALYDALEIAFATEGVDTIYLLTDGSPHGGRIDSKEAIRARVEAWNELAQITIHCVSLGRDSSLLRALSESSGGDYRVVNE